MKNKSYLDEKQEELWEYNRLLQMRENILEQWRSWYISEEAFQQAWNQLEDEIQNYLIKKNVYKPEINIGMLLCMVIQKVSIEINDILNGWGSGSWGRKWHAHRYETDNEQFYKNEAEDIARSEELECKKKQAREEMKRFRKQEEEYSRFHQKNGHRM